MEVEDGDNYSRIKGEFAIEWVRMVTGLELEFSCEGDFRSNYPCGLTDGHVQEYCIDGDESYMLIIHLNGICVIKRNRHILEQIVDYVNDRLAVAQRHIAKEA